MLSPTAADNSWKWAIALAIVTAAAIAPTLHVLQFSNSMENLNVATALEMRRGGPWLVPTLEGVPRIVKPPLTAWITALAIRPSTLADLDSRDDATRSHAYDKLAFESRWPGLLAGALTLLATFALGRTIIDARAGLLATAIFASSIFFLRFARFSTTDTHLMLWVTVTNVFLARIVLDGATWPTCIGAAIALGLAFMTKGPVALVQSVLPAALFMLPKLSSRFAWKKLVAGVAIFLGVALWWFVLVARRDSSVIHTWLSETNPGGGERMSHSNFALYAILFPYMMPWTIFLVVGFIYALVNLRHWSKSSLRAAYPAFVLLTSLIVMSCFHDRKERYILPLAPVAALIAAQCVRYVIERNVKLLLAIHWIIISTIALAPVPLILRSMSKEPPLPDPLGWFLWTLAAVALTVGVIASVQNRYGIIFATVAVMWVVQAMAIRAYSHFPSGRSDMRPLAEIIRHDYPDAEMYSWRADGQQKRSPVDLSIYLNRITRQISDPEKLAPSNRPQIYVTIRQQSEPELAPANGWKFLAEVPRDNDWYVAFVRDRAAE